MVILLGRYPIYRHRSRLVDEVSWPVVLSHDMDPALVGCIHFSEPLNCFGHVLVWNNPQTLTLSDELVFTPLFLLSGYCDVAILPSLPRPAYCMRWLDRSPRYMHLSGLVSWDSRSLVPVGVFPPWVRSWVSSDPD